MGLLFDANPPAPFPKREGGEENTSSLGDGFGEASSPESPPFDLLASLATQHSSPTTGRCRFRTRTSSSKRRRECSSSTSTRCTSASCSSNCARRMREGKLEVQRLLIPEPIDLPAEQAALVLEAADALKELGLEVVRLRRQHDPAFELPDAARPQAAARDLPGRGRSPADEGARRRRATRCSTCSWRRWPARPRSRPATGSRRRRSHDLLAAATTCRGLAPLPARPAHVAAVQPPGTRQAIPTHVTHASSMRR